MNEPQHDLLFRRVPERGPAQLVIVGEPGSGRTRILQTLATKTRAQGRNVSLLRPSNDDTHDQRGIGRALGIEIGQWSDHLELADALHNAWTTSAATDVICIDDVDLFDASTIKGICAAMRTLPLVVVLTAKGTKQLAAGLPEGDFYQLTGWVSNEIHEVIRKAAVRGPVPEVLDRLTSLAEGLPGAAKALATSLSAEQLLGFESLLPVTSPMSLELFFRSQVPSELYDAALLMACAVVGTPSALSSAGATMGIAASDFDDLERSGLATIKDGSLALHPAGMAFALEALSTAGERSSAHQALAVANDGEDDSRALWHRAQAVGGSDARLADRLEAMTDGPSRVMGFVPASHVLHRASELSTSSAERGRRLAAAAECAWLEGTPARSLRLLAQVESLSKDLELKMRVTYVRGSIELAAGSASLALRVMFDAVPAAIQRLPSSESTALLVRACDAAVAAGDVRTAVELGKHARKASVNITDSAGSARLALVIGTGKVLAEQFDAGMSLLDEVLIRCSQRTDQSHALVGMRAALISGDASVLADYADVAIDQLMENSNRGLLPFVTARRALADVLLGHFRGAIDTTVTGIAESTLLDQENARAEHLAVQALALARAGDVEQSTQVAGTALALASDCGLAWSGAVAVWALGEIELANGNPEQALEHLTLLWHGNKHERHPLIATLAAAETVEAAVRAGRSSEGDVALRRLIGWAEASSNSAIVATVERCLALRSQDSAATSESFQRALVLHREAARPFDEARTSLAYGAWLRRQRRKSESRVPLRRAYESFESIGAVGWRTVAAQEMRASGESVRGQDAVRSGRHLTAQEMTIAKMVADGDTNRDVAERLYLSVRTVEYHLRNVFAKLGLRSRTELAVQRGMLEELEALDAQR